MRLIDADALLAELERAKKDNEKCGMVLIDDDFETLIHDADTVEAQEEIDQLRLTIAQLREINERNASADYKEEVSWHRDRRENYEREIARLNAQGSGYRAAAVEIVTKLAREFAKELRGADE